MKLHVLACLSLLVFKSSLAEDHEKGNIHVLPSISQTLLPETHNSTSDGHNTTVPQVFPIYDTAHLNGSLLNSTGVGSEPPQQHDTFHHHGGQWGKEHNESCNHGHEMHDKPPHSGKRNHTCENGKPHNGSCAHGHGESSAEKVEQILWDIFTEEMDDEENDTSDEFRMSSDESEPGTEVVEETVHDESDDSSADSNELSSNEEVASDSHVISRRSATDSETPRGGRKSNNEHKNKSSRSKSKSKSKASSASVKKYNEYMDVVLKRMNTMIKGKNMDPLMVNLFSGANKGDKKKNGKKPASKVKGKKGGKNRARMETEEDDIELDNDHELTGDKFMRKDLEVDEEHDTDEDTNEQGTLFRNVRALILNGSMKRSAANTTEAEDDAHETRGFDSGETGKSKGAQKPKSSKKPGKKPKQQATRGILKGLSSLRRTGNVDVIRQGDKVRIVRSKFLLGPVMLEIVPKNTRSPKAQDEAQSSRVTAVASQLKGIIEVRLKKQSPTTIKRLRVFPPSSVKIKSSSTSKSQKASVPRYSKVTPVATHRLRQIASAVVRQADLAKKATHT